MKLPEKVLWLKTIIDNHYKSLTVIPNEYKYNFLKNRYSVRYRKMKVALLNQGFKFSIVLGENKKLEEALEREGFKVFKLDPFNDKDFFSLREEIVRYKKSKKEDILKLIS